MALLPALLVLFATGMMLFTFTFITRNELVFATLNRNRTIALGLAESGLQEALTTPRTNGLVVATQSTFTGSLLSGSGATALAVTIGPALSTNGALFPVTAVATYGGAQRKVRILRQVLPQPGFGDTMNAQNVNLGGDASAYQGDVYTTQYSSWQSLAKSPSCTAGTLEENLLPPEVLAGTYVTVGGAVSQSSCGPSISHFVQYTGECTTVLLTEVPPFACAKNSTVRQVPYNWHPFTPIAMASADFQAVTTQCAAACPAGVSMPQATQDGVGVTFAGSPVKLIVAQGVQFCVNGSAVTAGACAGLGATYGSTAQNTRYLNWAIISQDLNTTPATKFFQAPTCTSCANGGPNGNPNGIRYIPLIPVINVLATMQSCTPLMGATGSTVYVVQAGDGVSCNNVNGIKQYASVPSWTGTKTAPEALVVDNAGQSAVDPGAPGAGGQSCTSDLSGYGVGLVIATGDISLGSNEILTGYLYTLGNVSFSGTPIIQGGIFATSLSSGQVSGNGNAKICTGQNTLLPISTLFFSVNTLAWADVPLSAP